MRLTNFWKVRALVYLLHKVTIQRTFENMCLLCQRAHLRKHPGAASEKSVPFADLLCKGTKASTFIWHACILLLICHARYPRDLLYKGTKASTFIWHACILLLIWQARNPRDLLYKGTYSEHFPPPEFVPLALILDNFKGFRWEGAYRCYLIFF